VRSGSPITAIDSASGHDRRILCVPAMPRSWPKRLASAIRSLRSAAAPHEAPAVIILYEHPLSPYSQKCRIALAEKAIPFELRVPKQFGSGATTDGGFVERNPRHEVPLLVDGDVRIFDSTIILEYIEDKWPQPPLLPREPAERARVRMIEDAMDTQYEPINWGILEVAFFKRATGDLADILLASAREQTTRLQDWLEAELGDRAWFNGEDFGWGDLAVFPHVENSARSRIGPKPGSRLAAWLEQVRQRPSVVPVTAAATAFLQAFPDASAALRSGRYRRQYRDHRLEWMMRSGGLAVVVEGLENKTIRFSNEIS
jgi:glutathione S-transferase/RNA polymerase-associated protein